MVKKTVFIFWTERLNPLRGGVHRIIILLLKHLPLSGFNVHYLYTLDDYASFNIYNEDSSKEESIKVENLKSYLLDHHCEIILGQDGVFSNRLTQVVRQMALPGIKFINEYHNSLLLIPNKLSKEYLKFEFVNTKSLRVKIGSAIKYVFYPIWKWKIWKDVSKLYKFNFLNSDVTLLLSSREEPIVRLILSKNEKIKCVAIPNPLSWEKVEDESILIYKKKEVLVVSRIYNPEKRIDLVLKIWCELQKRNVTEGWILRIVGDGIHKPLLMKMAEDMKLRGVVWEGLSNPMPFYHSASLFMMTSSCEGWGLTLTESMQTGVVPLAFDSYPALRSIITDGYDGCIIEDDNLDAYADRMEYLMTHKEERERIARNGLDSCKRFTIDKIVSQWVDMINGL